MKKKHEKSWLLAAILIFLLFYVPAVAITRNAFVVIYGALFIFGCGFDWFVSWAHARHYDEGYTAILVAVGTAVTLAPFLFFPSVNILWVMGAFCASGAPMIAGDIVRYARARKAAQDYARQAP